MSIQLIFSKEHCTVGEKEQDTAALLQNGQNFRIVRFSPCGDGRDGEISRFLSILDSILNFLLILVWITL